MKKAYKRPYFLRWLNTLKILFHDIMYVSKLLVSIVHVSFYMYVDMSDSCTEGYTVNTGHSCTEWRNDWLQKAKFPCQVVFKSYRGNITNRCVSCPARLRGDLERVMKTAQNIICTHLPGIGDTVEVRCLHSTHNILKANTHPSRSLFIHLPTDTEVSATVPSDYRGLHTVIHH